MQLVRATPDDFDFTTAVGSHGFFALAPNRWDHRAQVLQTIVWADNLPLLIRLAPARRAGREALRIDVPACGSLTAVQRRGVIAGVRRALRLGENLAGFHAMCSQDGDLSQAAEMGFGRLLRSPTFFEDAIKTMCTCNITWRQTLTMVRRLVARYGRPTANEPTARAFPAAEELARADEADLRRSCGVGYRGEWMIALARRVADSEFDFAESGHADLSTDELYRRLRTIRGVGDYAASTLCMLLGRYDRLAIDSVLIDHYHRRYPRRQTTPANINRHYARYAPYQYLVYYWELWNRYRDAAGYPASWTAE